MDAPEDAQAPTPPGPAGTRARWSRLLLAGLVGLLLLACAFVPGMLSTRRELERRGIPAEGGELLRRASQGDGSAVRLLLRAGVSPQTRDEWDRTALHRAAWSHDLETLRFLVEAGADVNARDRQGRTPLAVAASHAVPGQVELLGEHGAELEARDETGITPLHRAVWGGDPTAIDFLLSRRVNLDAQDREGETALQLALRKGDRDLVIRLVQEGAQVNLRRADGAAPLHTAVMRTWPEIPMVLLTNRAEARIQDESGSTPLHRVVWDGTAEVAELLLSAGAPPSARDSVGRTPLHRARRTTDPGILDVLVHHGADVNAVDQGGRTPLDVARYQGNQALATRLEALGGRPSPSGNPREPHLEIPASRIPVLPAGERGRHFPASRFAPCRDRLRSFLAHGVLPIIDVEFHVSGMTPLEEIQGKMDELGIGAVWAGASPRQGSWLVCRLAESFPGQFLPLTCHGQEDPWITGDPAFLEELRRGLDAGAAFGMGEFEARHYGTQANDRDVYTPLTSPQFAYVFALSERYDAPLLLHHEAEDRLLPELETMLDRYPKARVVWCHGGRSRNPHLWTRMTDPAQVGSLLGRHPNLYLGLAQLPMMGAGLPNVDSVTLYDESGSTRLLTQGWKATIEAFPDRFTIGSDSNGIRIERYAHSMETMRSSVLASLPDSVAARVAFKNAWRIATGTDWED